MLNFDDPDCNPPNARTRRRANAKKQASPKNVRCTQSAALKLDDRFNPEDHVEVSIESMFDAIVRGPGVSQGTQSITNHGFQFGFLSCELTSRCFDPLTVHLAMLRASTISIAGSSRIGEPNATSIVSATVSPQLPSES